ncbi:MAG: response regulator transcription factor [Fibrobacter sp.]|nr:response regulator transcription factor [Fibrobacter sp.]
MKKLLIVDDDETLLSLLATFFEANGFDVVSVSSGEKALVSMKTASPDLVLLDLELPGINGFEVINRIRCEDSCTPIILMTGSWTDPQSKIKGYTLGAIQFLDKPVQTAVLLAQINNMLSKRRGESAYVVGDQCFSLDQLRLTNGAQAVDLTNREVKIMHVLFEHVGATVPRSILLKHIWGHDDPRTDKLLDNIIYQLRSKLAVFPMLTIRNNYGSGYLLIINDKSE